MGKWSIWRGLLPVIPMYLVGCTMVSDQSMDEWVFVLVMAAITCLGIVPVITILGTHRRRKLIEAAHSRHVESINGRAMSDEVRSEVRRSIDFSVAARAFQLQRPAPPPGYIVDENGELRSITGRAIGNPFDFDAVGGAGGFIVRNSILQASALDHRWPAKTKKPPERPPTKLVTVALKRRIILQSISKRKTP